MRAATSPRYAEFNFYVDPEAADAVLAAGLPLTLVPLDVTHQLVVRDETIEGRLLALKDRRSRFLGELIRRTRHEGCGDGQLILHDPGAVACVLWPELFTLRPFDLSVDLSHGDRRGAVSCKESRNSEMTARAPVRAAVDVDAAAIVRRVVDRLAAHQAAGA